MYKTHSIVAARVRLGVILVGRLDPLGFYCVTRMVIQGIVSVDRDTLLIKRGWVTEKSRHYRTICCSVFDAKLTSQSLTSSSNPTRRVYSTSA